MLQQDMAQDFVIATGSTHSLSEFLSEAFQSVDLDWKEHVNFDPTLARPTDLRVSCADPSHAASVLGWRASCFMSDVVRSMVSAELEKVKGMAIHLP